MEISTKELDELFFFFCLFPKQYITLFSLEVPSFRKLVIAMENRQSYLIAVTLLSPTYAFPEEICSSPWQVWEVQQ